MRETLQQNRIAERMNRTLLVKVHCMLSNVKLSKFFWVELLTYAYHLINRMPLPAIGGKTLLEVWSKKVGKDYDALRIFGCLAYYHVKEDKLGPRARKDVFVGFKKSVNGYKVWGPKDKKIILSSNVTFDEASMVKPMNS